MIPIHGKHFLRILKANKRLETLNRFPVRSSLRVSLIVGEMRLKISGTL